MSETVQSWIDPHIHLFALQEGHYNWLKPSNPPFWPDKSAIATCTTEQSLVRASQGQIAGFVHIEAGYDNARPWREVAFLERHCTLPFRSVAGIDLTQPSAGSHIDKLKGYKSVRGLRHILDDDAEALLRSPKVKWGLGHLAAQGLTFDAQFNLADSAAINALLNVLEKTPALNVAINHSAIAPQDSKSLVFKAWRKNVYNLAESGQAVFKFSGLEMQNRNWQWQRASFIFETLLDTVGVNKLMFASNYPLCQWRMPYANLWQDFLAMTTPLNNEQKAALVSSNAKQWYDIA